MVHWSALCDSDPALYSKYLEVAQRYVDTFGDKLTTGVGSCGGICGRAGGVVETNGSGLADCGDGRVYTDVGGPVRSLVEGFRDPRIGGRRCGASAGYACACVFSYSQCCCADSGIRGCNRLGVGGDGVFRIGYDRFGDGGSAGARDVGLGVAGGVGFDDDAARRGDAGTVVESGQDGNERRADGGGEVTGVVRDGVGKDGELRGVRYTCGRRTDEVVECARGEQRDQQKEVSGLAGVQQSSCVAGMDLGSGKYVPPHARIGSEGPVRGKHYASNKAAKERRKLAKQRVSGSVVVGDRTWGTSTFAACTQQQRDDLQQSRAVRLMAENKLKAVEADLKLARLQAEKEFALKDVESGAYVNRIQMRNEAMDKKWQDQAENVQSYRRSSPVQGWVKTVASGSGSGPSSPRSVPTLTSGGSPRSESDWELEMKRRDERIDQLCVQVRELIAENEGHVGSCGDYDSRNFNQPEHYGSTKDGEEPAIPWEQDPLVVEMYRLSRERVG